MSKRVVSLIYACVLMAGFGIGVAAFGPLLPELAENNGLAMSQMGIIFPAIFAGTIPASLLVGVALDRFGANRIILISIPVLAGSAIGLTFSRSLPLLLVLSVLIGAGGGAGVPTANTLIVKLFGRRSVAAVNLLNVFFGVGAIAGPALVSLGLSLFGSGTPVFWLAAAIALACLPYFITASLRAGPPIDIARAEETREERRRSREQARHQEWEAARGRLRAVRALFRSPLLWLIGWLLFFDVGTEQTLGGWMAVYMQLSTRVAMTTAALVVSGFWVAFTVGRLAGAGIGTRITARRVLAGALITACAGILVVNLTHGYTVPSIAGFLLTGLGLGPVYPTTMALIGTTFTTRAGTVIGATAALGTIGGMGLPFLEGIFMDSFGPPGAAGLLGAAVIAIVVFSAASLLRIARKGE